MFKRINRTKKGAALIEYALLVAGVALMAAAAVSVFGNKTADMFAAVTSILPGAQGADNGTITTGQLIDTTTGPNGGIIVNVAQEGTLGDNFGLDSADSDGFGGLVQDAADIE